VPKGCPKKSEEMKVVQAAHQYCTGHRNSILESASCGCFHCLSIFSPDKIDEWIDENVQGEGQTALCPVCGIDAVLGDQSGFPIEKAFLK
jgi:hypothetical protein